MANQLDLGLRAFDVNGYISAGAKALVYLTGTSTLIDVWADADGIIAAANPVIADGNGYWPQRFVSQTAKVVITDADDVTLQTLDPAPTSIGTGSAASDVSFTPTVEVPFTNVQDAVQGTALSVLAGVTAYGIGITGNAPLLANIDATNTAAGIYRFDGATTGTYPTGVVAADFGMIEQWRQSATVGMMELHHATTNRRFRRRLTAGAWGAWRESVDVNIGATAGDIIYRGASDWTRLAAGLATQSLVMNAGATAPEWKGARALLATKTASASATLDFTEFNNAVYSQYEFELDSVKPANDGVDLGMRFSTNAGSSYDSGASDYPWQINRVTGGTNAGGGSASNFLPVSFTNAMGNAAAEHGVSGRVTMYNAGTATVYTRVLFDTSLEGTSSELVHYTGTGRRSIVQDTDAVRFLMSAGNIASGRIRMYGVS